MKVLTLCWDPEEGQGTVNLKGLDKLYGVEKVDFLVDVIEILMEEARKQGTEFLKDYKVDN